MDIVRPTRTLRALPFAPATQYTNRAVASPQLFTIGYEGRDVASFVHALVAESISRVIDVRELPLSRRRGFSKTPLRAALEAAGIEYVHLREAGNPYRDRKQDIATCLGLYRRHVAKNPDVIDRVLLAAGNRRTALLCVEADVRNCHRSVLVDGIRAREPHRNVRDL